jgi:hypothetical protein
MVMPNETLLGERLTKAPEKCEECSKPLIPEVLMSAAGYYIGTKCDCGPYSKESTYFKTREEAEKILLIWKASLFKNTPFRRS